MRKQAFFYMKTGDLFRSVVCTMFWGWYLAKDCLSDCFRPMGPRSTAPSSHQSQALKGCPLCRLCMSTSCGGVGHSCSTQGQGTPIRVSRLEVGCKNVACQHLHPERVPNRFLALRHML